MLQVEKEGEQNERKDRANVQCILRHLHLQAVPGSQNTRSYPVSQGLSRGEVFLIKDRVCLCYLSVNGKTMAQIIE
jgi:hypothetical protein